MSQAKAQQKINLPKVIFGTSALGNLYTALPIEVKEEIVSNCVKYSPAPVVFDSAGKYGAGLALEALAECLDRLEVDPSSVVISNKLGWFRTELTTEEPTFEPGVWRDLKFDAVQKISYEGILECFEQGNKLLGKYAPQFISIHDPDEYLATANSAEEEAELYNDVLEAYKALATLRETHGVLIGVGAKTWTTIQRIASDIDLDWVMFANSMTIRKHPSDLLEFMEELKAKNVRIINSAVFHAGFLTGGDYYDYKLIKPDTEENKAIFKWREDFFRLCNQFNIKPAAACVQFALSAPGVVSIALNTTNPGRVEENVQLAYQEIPVDFWAAMKNEGLISKEYNYL
ncbi:aldo/keto reductase [Desertivirga brevis]|uniref:aldo/keto reductase n=1 Tax=Desertivirga brevis TaxID=2810310 RepID=UPI001A96AFEB|nr:aldo/keto reductase [Pedobacter sp. SYSU D00873]